MFGDIEKISKEYGVGGGGWFKPEVGDNRVRIISEFVDYGNHFDASAKKSIICTGSDTCPICLAAIKAGTYQDNKPGVQFLGYVIDRKDKAIKLYRMGWGVFNEINELSVKADYAFDKIPPYDIIINRVGTGKNDTRYKVIAARQNTALTEDEQVEIEGLKPIQEVLDDMVAKQGEPEKYEESVDDINAKI
jgi:hypothetical protein